MPSLDEILEAGSYGPSQIHDALVAGVDVLGQNQTVDFTPYIRVVLPVDGFVFWVRADLLPPEKISAYGMATSGVVTVPGSLHYATIGFMVEDETTAIRKVDFTAENQITAFAEITADVMYVATWQTPLGSFQFTFSQRGSYYVQADLHHYVGDAVYPTFTTQLINDISQFDQRQVVSNSLPLWLKMAAEVPYVSLVTSSVQLYPAFLVPPNTRPPYGTVDIVPGTTRALSAMPARGPNSEQSQLCAETARLSFYGLRNEEVMDFTGYVFDRALNVDDFGIMNMPVVRDEHRPQVELAVLAMKKTVDFEISYVQGRMRDIARKLISSTLITVTGSDKPLLFEPERIIQPFMAPSDPLKFPI